MCTITSSPTPEISSAEKLVNKLKNKQWNAVIDHAKSNPADVNVVIANNRSLHLACELAAPIQVIKALLSASPKAVETKCGLHDRLPLHCLLAAPHTPLENTVSLLVEAYPTACRISNKIGNLPIHLICQAAHISDGIFTIILSSYPEGAYVKNMAGNYPLHMAAANKDMATRKIALAALDRGTLYASISKMTSIRLSKEHETSIKLLKKSHLDKMSKVEVLAKEERTKLKAQIDNLNLQIKIEKEGNTKLQEDMNAQSVQHEDDMKLAIAKEQTKALNMESTLRSELADVQLKNMDMLMDAAEVQDELTFAQTTNKEKSKYIAQLESSLQTAKESILTLVREQERMKAAMISQKEALASILVGHDTAIEDAGVLTDKMAALAVDIGEATDMTAEGVKESVDVSGKDEKGKDEEEEQ